MDNDPTKDALNNEPEIHLMSPDFQIMQDIEEDLEDYSRLSKLGRFGEASRLFRETLHRHLGCFAVLVEHCNVLIDQEDFENAELILSHSIKRQEMFATGPERFGSSESHLLRLLLMYASECKGNDGSETAEEEKATLFKARWHRDSVTASSAEDLTDVQRQILLTWLRIIFNSRSYERSCESTEDLRLPWSLRPLYHDDTLTLSEDYITWFETLVPEHPWDACIVLRYLCYLRPPSLFHQDWSVFLGIINRNFEDSSSVDASLFGRMSLLWTLGEVALMRRCGAFHEEEYAHRYTTVHAVADPESDGLMQSIRTILQKHSEVLEVTQTRPYKRLQLLLIDHETLRHHQPGDAEIAIKQNLPQLHAIEEFAMSPDIHDHALGIDTLLHYYLFTAAKDIRKVMSNKIAHFSSRFGTTGESMMLHKIITGSYYNAHSVPNRGHLILLVLGQNPMARVSGGKRSMLQTIFCNSENEDFASSRTYYHHRLRMDHAVEDVISETSYKQDSEFDKSRAPSIPEKIEEISKTGLKGDEVTQAAEGIPLNLSGLTNLLAIELGKILQKEYSLDLAKRLERETSHDIPAGEVWKKEYEELPTEARNSKLNTQELATLQVRIN